MAPKAPAGKKKTSSSKTKQKRVSIYEVIAEKRPFDPEDLFKFLESAPHEDRVWKRPLGDPVEGVVHRESVNVNGTAQTLPVIEYRVLHSDDPLLLNTGTGNVREVEKSEEEVFFDPTYVAFFKLDKAQSPELERWGCFVLPTGQYPPRAASFEKYLRLRVAAQLDLVAILRDEQSQQEFLASFDRVTEFNLSMSGAQFDLALLDPKAKKLAEAMDTIRTEFRGGTIEIVVKGDSPIDRENMGERAAALNVRRSYFKKFAVKGRIDGAEEMLDLINSRVTVATQVIFDTSSGSVLPSEAAKALQDAYARYRE